MENKFFDTKLEALLTKTAFDELSVEEKSYVLNLLSEEEYMQCFFLLSKSKGALLTGRDSLQPAPNTFNVLKEAFIAKTVVEKPLYASVLKKPVYQGLMAAILLILIISLYAILPLGNKQPRLTKKEIKPHLINNLIANKAIVAHPPKITVTKLPNKLMGKQNLAHVSVLKANSVVKITIGNNLCIDVPAAAMSLSDADSTGNYIPCLNTMLVIPESGIHSYPQ